MSKQISNGTYGCIYYPRIPCINDKESSDNDKYITKIQTAESDAITIELEVSKIVKEKIKDYVYYYAPIISSCKIDLNVIDENNKCKRIEEELKKNTQKNTQKDTQKDTQIISYKIKYLGTQNWNKKVVEWYKTLDPLMFRIKLIDSLTYIVFSLKKLNEQAGIIHNDMKENNIMYDEINDCPIIIDFGLSRIINQDITKMKFFTHIFWLYCFDSFIMGILNKAPTTNQNQKQQKQSENIDPTTINNYLIEFTEPEKNRIFMENHKDNIFNANEKNEIVAAYNKKIKGWTKSSTIKRKELMNNIFQKTYKVWDLYSLLISTIYIINEILEKEKSTTTTTTTTNENAEFLKHLREYSKKHLIRFASGEIEDTEPYTQELINMRVWEPPTDIPEDNQDNQAKRPQK